MRHTFFNVDMALVKIHHSLMVTEQECLPPSQVNCNEMLLFDSFSLAEKILWYSQKNGNVFPHLPPSLPFPFHSVESQWVK